MIKATLLTRLVHQTFHSQKWWIFVGWISVGLMVLFLSTRIAKRSLPTPPPSSQTRENWQAELQLIDTALTQQPSAVPLLLRKARLLILLGNHDDVITLINQVEQLDPNTPTVRKVLSQLYSALGSPSASPLP